MTISLERVVRPTSCLILGAPCQQWVWQNYRAVQLVFLWWFHVGHWRIVWTGVWKVVRRDRTWCRGRRCLWASTVTSRQVSARLEQPATRSPTLPHSWTVPPRSKHTAVLTLWRPLLPYGCSCKASYASQTGLSRHFLNFWHPGTLTLSPERQSARMSKITNDDLTQSGIGYFIAVPIWQQWASNGSVGNCLRDECSTLLQT